MEKEKKFTKYETMGSDYHYRQIEKNVFRFNSFVFSRYTQHVNVVKDYLKKKPGGDGGLKLLDVGCGDGVLLYLLKKTFGQNIELFGIDSSEEAIMIARKQIPEAHFICGDVYQIKFPENHFDIVVSSDVIEHVLYPKKMLAEIQRVTKKNAFVSIGTPIRFTEYPIDLNHAHEFFQNEFTEIMKGSFGNCHLIETHPLLFSLLYKRAFPCFGKNIPLFKYVINILHIYLGINLFEPNKTLDSRSMSYMIAVSKKEEASQVCYEHI